MIKTKHELDSFLKSNGISQQAIKHAKSITPKYANNKEKEYYYDFINTTNSIEKVTIKNIYSPARNVNEDYNWYDNLYFTLTDQAQKYNINLEKKRFENLLKKLSSIKAKKFIDLIENANDGNSLDYIHRFSKYIDENGKEIYYQNGFHAHKLVLAKVIGAKYLTSDCITTYKFNNYKYSIFSKLLQQQERLIETIHKSTLFEMCIDDGDLYIQFNSEIIPKKQRYLINIVGDFDDLLKKPYANEFKKHTSKYENKIKELYQYEIAILTLEKMVTIENNYYHLLPKFLLQKNLEANSQISIEELCTNPSKIIQSIKCMQALKHKIF